MPRLADIPGRQEARFRERLIRERPFLGLLEDIGPFKVRSMTVRDYGILKLRCPRLFLGDVPEPDELAAFLWLLSPEYTSEGRGRRRFMKRCQRFMPTRRPILLTRRAIARWEAQQQAALDYARGIVASAREYIEETLMDRPPAGDRPREDYYSEQAWLVAAFGREFGWTVEETMNLPLKIAWQLQAEMRENRGMKASLSNPLSDQVVRDYFASQRKN